MKSLPKLDENVMSTLPLLVNFLHLDYMYIFSLYTETLRRSPKLISYIYIVTLKMYK